MDSVFACGFKISFLVSLLTVFKSGIDVFRGLQAGPTKQVSVLPVVLSHYIIITVLKVNV